MLGMFLMLPVLALYAHTLPDYSPELLGLAMGAYGLTQAVLQIPFGRWSDRFGRKPLITIGLLFYAVGSVIGMFAHTTWLLALARGVQGAGAVSASVTALMADLTRTEVRTRAMAVIGISIGLSFVVALIVAPALDAAVGVPGIFGIMLAMAILGLLLLHLAVPAEPERTGGAESRTLSGMLEIVSRPQLRPLYFGMFALHCDHDGDVHLGAAGARDEPRHPERGALEGLPGRVPGLDRGHRCRWCSRPSAAAGAGVLFVLAVALTGVCAGAARPRPRAPLGGARGADPVLRGLQLPRGPAAGPADPVGPGGRPRRRPRRLRHRPSSWVRSSAA